MLENQMQEINFSTKDYPIFLDQMTQEEFIEKERLKHGDKQDY